MTAGGTAPPIQLGLALAPALTRCLSRTQANVLKTASLNGTEALAHLSRELHLFLLN